METKKALSHSIFFILALCFVLLISVWTAYAEPAGSPIGRTGISGDTVADSGPDAAHLVKSLSVPAKADGKGPWKTQDASGAETEAENTQESVLADKADSETDSPSELQEKNKECKATVWAWQYLEGKEFPAGTFSVQLLYYGKEPDKLLSPVVVEEQKNLDVDKTEYLPAGGERQTNPHYMMAPFVFQELTFTEPGVYHYQLREMTIPELEEEYVLDSVAMNFTISVTDEDGILKADVPSKEAVFSNRVKIKRGGDLILRAEGYSPTTRNHNQNFVYTVAFENVSEPITCTVRNPETGEETNVKSIIEDGEYSFTIGPGDEIVFSGVNIGAKYSMQAEERPGWALEYSEKTAGEIPDGKEQTVALFVHRYHSANSIKLLAHVSFQGEAIQPEQFQFELKDESGRVLDRQYADAAGDVVFEPLFFSAENDGEIFTYFISEVNSGEEFVAYDDEPKEVILSVEDDCAGKLLLSAAYTGNGKAAEFVNTKIVKVPFVLTADIRGNNGKKGYEFPFRMILMKNGKPFTDFSAPDEIVDFQNEGNGEYSFRIKRGKEVQFVLQDGVSWDITEFPDGDTDGYTSMYSVTHGERMTAKDISDTRSKGRINASDMTIRVAYKNTSSVIASAGISGFDEAYIIGALLCLLFILVPIAITYQKKHPKQQPAKNKPSANNAKKYSTTNRSQ